MMPSPVPAVTVLAGLFLLIIFSGFAAEVLLRRLRPEMDFYCVLEPCQRKTLRLADNVVQGVAPVARFETNSYGIRARGFSSQDQYRILAVGCSVTISMYVDQKKTWPYLLEQRLQRSTGQSIWVGNVGKDAILTRDLITFMQFLVPQYKQHIRFLVMLPGVNDLSLMLSKGANYIPFYSDHMGLEHRLRRAFCRLPISRSSEKFYRRTLLWRAAGCMKHSLLGQTYDGEGDFYIAKREARQKADAIIDSLPDVSPGLEEYVHNLNRIIDLAHDLDLGLLFMTQPHLWRADLSAEDEKLLWFGWIAGTSHYYSVHVLAEGMRLYNQALLKVCDDRKVDCLDLAALLPQSTQVFYDDVHFNETGSSLVAEELDRYFNSKLFRSSGSG